MNSMNARFTLQKSARRDGHAVSGRVSRTARAKTVFCGFLLACGAVWGWGENGAAAATLDIDLDVRTRAEAAAARPQRDVVVLVVDRSGSMTNPAAEVGRPAEMRDAVLKEMLRNRLEMMAEARPDAEVWIISFASAISKPQGPYAPKDADRIIRQLADPDGCTLLYDAMARAVEFGEEQMKKDAARVGVYFYSDGDNYFPASRWKDPEASWLNNQVPVRYNGDDAAARFARDFNDRIRAYADAGKMSLETGGWLGAGTPPAMIENKRKDEYPLELTADGTSLKNPAAAPSQGLKARLLVPLPERFAKDLDRLEAALVFEAGKQRSVARFPLAPGKKKVRLALPDGLPAAAFSGQLRVSALPDAWKSAALAEPEPVELSFAEPGALSLSGVTPRGECWTATGTPVEFSAEATDGAEVTWTIDGRDAGKGTFETAFDRAGTHRAVATARKAGFRPATAECTIHAVDTMVQVVAPAGARVGEKVAFEAKTAGGGGNVSWWVDGLPAEGKEARLEGRTFDASGHHTAKARVYFGHGLSGEGEAHFEVSVAPNVSIDQPWNGQEFASGEEIRVGAKVEGDFDRVVWTLRGPEEAANEAEVDRGERRTVPATFKPGKGGDYELSAVAEGPAGRLEAKPVRFAVAREDAWVRIESPKSGSVIPTGGNTDLRAVAQGEETGEIRWTVKDQGGNVLFSATRPTEGGVSQCSFAVPEALGNGTTLFVSAEAAGDPALRAENDVETRCANCAGMGAVLSLSHDGVEGRTFGRGERIVAELKDLRGEVRDIEWTFGDAGRAAGRVAEWDGWADYGVYPVKAAGRCGKCGAVREFGQEQVIVERRPVTAAFEIAERGSYCTAGGKLHLASTGGGDIADYVWTVDGEELAAFRGKPQAEVELPFKPCDMVVSLTVSGPGEGETASADREIRVRYGWWAAVPAVLVLCMLLFAAGRVFLNNGPRKWEFFTWEGPAPKPVNGGYPAELGDSYLDKGVSLEGLRKWNYWTKKGKIRLGDMLMLDGACDNVWIPLAEEEFEVKKMNGAPAVTPPAGKFKDETGGIDPNNECPGYFLFRYCGSDYMDSISGAHDHVRVRVVENGGGAAGVVAFLLAFGLLVWAFAEFCLRYAI